MEFIYIVGAQCTGKTTLTRDVAEDLARTSPGLKCFSLSEVARSVLRLHGFTREDVRNGGERCLELQKLIMENQLISERQAAGNNIDVVVSDRSGLDPLVYAHMYCEPEWIDGLLNSTTWAELEDNLHKSILVVCEPVKEWLVDDGIRIMPLDYMEWIKIHTLFLDLLRRYNIRHFVLPATIQSSQDRIDFVQSLRINGGTKSQEG